MSNDEYRHHFSPPAQTDAQAANSATPDTDPQPYGDDPEHMAYVLATDPYGWSELTGICFACGAEIGERHSCEGLRAYLDERQEDQPL
jgi:hypothetical protein